MDIHYIYVCHSAKAIYLFRDEEAMNEHRLALSYVGNDGFHMVIHGSVEEASKVITSMQYFSSDFQGYELCSYKED